VSDAASGPERFLDLVESLVRASTRLSRLQAALLTACALDIASDSRTFARLFGVEHALVLRELNILAAPGELLVITKRDPRSLRSHFHLTSSARTMFDTAEAPITGSKIRNLFGIRGQDRYV
jgi:hypothetical protein